MDRFADIKASYDRGALTATDAVLRILFSLSRETPSCKLLEAGPDLISELREFLDNCHSDIPRNTGPESVTIDQVQIARELLKESKN